MLTLGYRRHLYTNLYNFRMSSRVTDIQHGYRYQCVACGYIGIKFRVQEYWLEKHCDPDYIPYTDSLARCDNHLASKHEGERFEDIFAVAKCQLGEDTSRRWRAMQDAAQPDELG